MLRKEIKFTGLDGSVQSEVWYFNLNEAEVTRLEAAYPGGLVEYIKSIDTDEQPDKLLEVFEELMQRSVGAKNKEGTRFIKNQEILDDFLASPAYSALFVELASNPDTAEAFFQGSLSKAYVDPPQANKPTG